MVIAMNSIDLNSRLHELYVHALENLDFVSEVLINDQEGSDKSVEWLLTEAGYSIAGFSRAIRSAPFIRWQNALFMLS